MNTLSTKLKTVSLVKNLMNALIFIAHSIAGYILVPSSNIVVKGAGIFLLILASYTFIDRFLKK